MAKHEPCAHNETFLGNTLREGGSMTYLVGELKTIRLGGTAYDIDGKALPSIYAPLFLHRSEVGAYDAIMIERGRT